MEKPDRRPISLAGLSLIGAGAVLGVALVVPTAATSSDAQRPVRSDSATVAERDSPDR